MVIKNLSQSRIISKNAKFAVSFIDRIIGLINTNTPQFLVINTHFGIHTFFMKKPIDIILLDKNNIVVKIKENLSPNKIFLYNPKFSTVIEMPMGTVEKFQISINDKISIE